MSPIIRIIVVAVIILLIVIQALLSKKENWIWGGIIPLIIIIAAVCTFTILKVDFNTRNSLPFAIALLCNLQEWINGRKKFKMQKEKEIGIRNIKDIK